MQLAGTMGHQNQKQKIKYVVRILFFKSIFWILHIGTILKASLKIGQLPLGGLENESFRIAPMFVFFYKIKFWIFLIFVQAKIKTELQETKEKLSAKDCDAKKARRQIESLTRRDESSMKLVTQWHAMISMKHTVDKTEHFVNTPMATKWVSFKKPKMRWVFDSMNDDRALRIDWRDRSILYW